MYTTRKTVDLYDIQVDYGYGDGFETVYTAISLSEAKARKKDYIQNDSFPVRIHSYRERRNFCDSIIFSVSNDNGKNVTFLAKSALSRFVQFVQYYTFVEYCDSYAPLEDILNNGFANYVKSEIINQRQLQRRITREELYEIFTHYNNGKMPRVIDNVKNIDESIPEGMYIVKV